MTEIKAKNAKGKIPAKSNPVARDTLFISHATPRDNAFATWLASRLSMAGYEVWCDKQKLLGGEDFWKDIERAIRNRAVKFVLVISEFAFSDEGELRARSKIIIEWFQRLVILFVCLEHGGSNGLDRNHSSAA